jgi:hypothetical protein
MVNMQLMDYSNMHQFNSLTKYGLTLPIASVASMY